VASHRVIPPLAVGLALICSCASTRLEPGQIAIAVDHASLRCSSETHTSAVQLILKNNGYRALRIGVDPVRAPAPPYPVSWLYYKVQDNPKQPDQVDWRHGPGGHGPMPPETLRIAPGDSTRILTPIYGLATADRAKQYRIQFSDLAGNGYTSEWFTPCTVSP
jgi:hypothetical protein